MGWSQKKIENHKKTASCLNSIKDDTFKFIGKNKNVTEYEVQQFVLRQIKKQGMRTGNQHKRPIVAFRENTAFVHYYPKRGSKKLSPESLILVDVWAQLNKKGSPFADITWMGYYGKKIPREILKIFNIIIKARDETIKYIKGSLKNKKIPDTCLVDKKARDIIKKNGFGKNFLHTTGHSLGFVSPHGGKRIGPKGKGKLVKNLAYTIEPGIYLKDNFGVRSEIDFYLTDDMKIEVTTKIQKKIIKIR